MSVFGEDGLEGIEGGSRVTVSVSLSKRDCCSESV